MSRDPKQQVMSVIAAAAAMTVAATAAQAQSTWDAGAGTVAGTFNTGLSQQQNVDYYIWDNTGSGAGNWNPDGYTQFGATVFNQGSGTFLISPKRFDHDNDGGTTPEQGMAPVSMTFSGAATYHFLRSSTSSTSNNAAGWANTFAGVGVDSFSSLSPFDLSVGNSSINLTSGFSGKVIFGAQAAGFSGSQGTIDISGGSLEIQHAGALPGISNNAANVTLSGGDLAVNITQGNYTFRQNNHQPSSGQMAGTLTVTANSSLSNTALDGHGRARETQNFWNGSVNVSPDQTLTVNTGGGVVMGNNVAGATLGGSGTLRIGTAAANSDGSNRLRLNGTQLGAGSTTLNFDTGATGILQHGLANGGTNNLGSLSGGTGSFLTGSSTGAGAASPAINATTISIGANGASTAFDGTITNGQASNTSSGSPAGSPPVGGRSNMLTSVTKVGAGTLNLNGTNVYGGSTTVSGGTLRLGGAHAIGDGGQNVTVNAGGTLDFNGNSQEAGKAYVLNGGSLINDGASPVTIHDGASGHFTPNNTTGGSGAWQGAGNTPTVTVADGGGSGATAQAILQLGWLRHSEGAGVGSGYLVDPKITFSAPDLPNGRPIKAVAILTNPSAAGGSSVSGVTIIDPGYGYTSVPTISIDDTGTGGSGFLPAFSMTLAGVQFTDGGTGYTSAPTLTFAGPGYVAGSASGAGNFGQISLTASSSIGGSGNLVVDAVASGAGGLNKIGAGAVFLNAANTYLGLTDVQAGALGGIGSIAGNLLVGGAGTMAPGASIESFGVGGNADIDGSFVVEFDGAGAGSIDLLEVTGLLDIAAATVDFNQLGGALDDASYRFASYGTLAGPFASVIDLPAGYTIDYAFNDGIDSNNIALVAVPEPTAVAALAVAGLGLLARRRRRTA